MKRALSLAAVLLASVGCQERKEPAAAIITGRQLRGTLKATMTGSSSSGGYAGKNIHQTDAALLLTVNADRSVTGTAHLKYSFHGEGRQSCGDTSSFTEPVEIDLPITGSWTETGIVFRINSDVQITAPHKSVICGRVYRSVTPINSSARISTGEAIMEFTVNRSGETYSGQYHWTADGPQGTTPMTSDWEVRLQPEHARPAG